MREKKNLVKQSGPSEITTASVSMPLGSPSRGGLQQQSIERYSTRKHDLGEMRDAVDQALLNYGSAHLLPFEAMTSRSSTLQTFVTSLIQLTEQQILQQSMPTYTIPNRDRMQLHILLPANERVRQTIREICRNSIEHGALPSITADGWTAGDGRHYLGVTLHILTKCSGTWERKQWFVGLFEFDEGRQTAEAYKEKLIQAISLIVPFTSVHSATFDNCSTMIKLGRILGVPNSLNCAAHAMQTAVKYAMNEPKCAQILATVKTLIKEISAPTMIFQLNGVQFDAGGVRRILRNPGQTRWDSEYDAMQRVHEELKHLRILKAHLMDVKPMTADIRTAISAIQATDIESENIHALLLLLGRVRDLSLQLQSRTACISLCAAIFFKLLLRLDPIEGEAQFISAFKIILTKEIKARLGDSFLSFNSYGLIASVFHPKCKDLVFVASMQQRSDVWLHVCKLLELVAAEGTRTIEASMRLDTVKQRSHSMLDDLFEDDNDNEHQIIVEESCAKELDRYREFECPALDMKLPAIEWWNKFGSQFPTLMKLALRMLSCQPSTSESERAFSQSGLVSSHKRTRLDPLYLSELTFHRCNCAMLQKVRDIGREKRAARIGSRSLLKNPASVSTLFEQDNEDTEVETDEDVDPVLSTSF